MDISVRDSLIILSTLYFFGFISLLSIPTNKNNSFNKSFPYFSGYFLLKILGIFGIYFRESLPIFISFVGVSFILYLSQTSLLIAINKFYKTDVPSKFIIISTTLYMSIFLIFLYIYPNLKIRMIALVIGSIFNLGYIYYRHNTQVKLHKLTRDIFGATIVIIIAINIFRLLILLLSVNVNSLLDYNSLSFMNIFAGIIGNMVAFGILSVVNNQNLNNLMKSVTIFKNSITNAPVPIIIYVEDGTVLNISKNLTELTSYEKSDIPTIFDWAEKAHSKNKNEIINFINNLYISKEKQHYGEIVVMTKDKEKLIWDFYSGYIGDLPDGRAVVMSIATDVTKFKIIDQKKKESEKQYKLLISQIPLGMIHYKIYHDIENETIDFQIIGVNKAFETLVGKSGSDLVGKNLQDIFLNMEQYWVDVFEEVAISGKTRIFENYTESIDCYIKVIAYKIKEDQMVIIVENITEDKKKQEEILYISYHDSLTDLPNRLLLEDLAKKLMKDANKNKTNIAFLFLGLDRFKNINDALGRSIGDKLLKEVSKYLKKILIENEVLARLGGDEFTILIPSFGFIDDLKVRVEKILDRFKYPFSIDDKEVFITASIGISQYPIDGMTLGKILENANTAMYFSKRSGRDNYKFYTENMNTKTMKNLDLENRMRKALKEEEFFLEYQPQVSTNTKKIISCEALVRWRSPEFGIVSPGDFICIAEDSGLILPLTRWILEKVFHEVKKVSKIDPNIYISVNISGYQIKHGNLIEMIEEVLEKEKIDLKNIELELTESILMEDITKNIETMSKLKDLKLKLAIDDFGTGYSSLSYIKKFPIDKLKIDKSFVDGIPTNEDDNIIVKTIISMAHNLGFKVTAEGVETKEQFDFLKTYKCDEIQGYYFSKPVSIEKIQEYLKEDTFNLL